jgi:hypothetical protein
VTLGLDCAVCRYLDVDHPPRTIVYGHLVCAEHEEAVRECGPNFDDIIESITKGL